MPVNEILTLIGIVFVGFLIAGALAPLEALGWWAGWYEVAALIEAETGPDVTEHRPEANHYVVFLSGIHSVSDEVYAEREIAFLERLSASLPNAEVIGDVFPYSVINKALTGQRVFARLWRWALARKLHGPGLAGFLINVRNLWQVAVSADSRYGPIYNQGSAEIILAGLERHGYEVGSRMPVTLIGYSGGGQIALGAVPYLKAVLKAPIRVISLGGVLCSDPGLLAVERLYHLYGRYDRVQLLGAIFAPGRWPILPHSPWNQAKRDGIIEFVPMGPVKHSDTGGYLDPVRQFDNGDSYLEHTIEVMTKLIAEGAGREQIDDQRAGSSLKELSASSGGRRDRG